MSDPIVRIAARGDGVTAAGRHVPFAVPGDVLGDDGVLHRGPGHQVPPCRHFPQCGGCQLQHLSDQSYADYCESRVAGALEQHGMATSIRAAHLSPPRSRRRATLHALKAGGRVLIGFKEAGRTTIVDMSECHVLHPRLFALLPSLRQLLGVLLPARRVGEVHLTLSDQGPDLMLKGVEVEGLEAAERLTAFANANLLARLSIDEGYGAEARFEPQPVTVNLGGLAVPLPVGGFLQATEDGEAALVAAVREALDGADRTADLFAGLGTFSLALASCSTAAEASREAALALHAAAARAGRALRVEHRDLYRRPCDAKELAAFDSVVLDPPRAGAEAQVRELAGSGVRKIAYVSCNPATFARDAAILIGGGYRIDWVQPVGQFRWSTHVELAACISR